MLRLGFPEGVAVARQPKCPSRPALSPMLSTTPAWAVAASIVSVLSSGEAGPCEQPRSALRVGVQPCLLRGRICGQ